MEFKDVKSSNINGVHYSPETKVLHIKYRNGGVYRYQDVSAEKHSDLLAADSIGSFVHNHIKGKHAHSKVEVKT